MNTKFNRVGEKHITHQGYEIEIIEYINNKKIKILFVKEGFIVENISYAQILSRFVKIPKEIKNGEQYITNEGYKVTIINFLNDKKCDISFEDGSIIKNRYYCDIKRGNVKNPFHKAVFGVGYLGDGEYKANTGSKLYYRWVNMIKRCYSEERQLKQPTYKDVTVCDEWHNFQNFAKWFDKNYIEGFHLDKDILVKGNKIYSPETCCFVPQEINGLFTNRKNKRGKYPIGVRITKSGNFLVKVRLNNKEKSLGTYGTVEEAFQAYKTAKEQYIKEVADKWRGQITEQVYKAMIDYQVEITD